MIVSLRRKCHFLLRLATTKQYNALSKASSFPLFKTPARLFSDEYIVSPFEDHEVYDAHRKDMLKRDGPDVLPQNHADYFIIGGGIMGQALAYNLWRTIEAMTPIKAKKEYSVTIAVCEKDPTFDIPGTPSGGWGIRTYQATIFGHRVIKSFANNLLKVHVMSGFQIPIHKLSQASTPLAVGGIRTQFSHPANIKLSMMSSVFLNTLKMSLSTVENPDPDVQLQRQGYLMLATENGADQLMKNYKTQIEQGAKIMLLPQAHLKETFPWLNVKDIELATYGVENEGWFDPTMYADCFRQKNPSLGIRYIKGEVVGVKKESLKNRRLSDPNIIDGPDGEMLVPDYRVHGVYVKMPEHDKPVFIKTAHVINCAGPMSGKVAEMCGIGSDEPDINPIAKVKVPVERRKRYVYVVHCPDAPMFDLPFVVDPSGVYVRREGFGGKYVCGAAPPTEEDEPDCSNLEVDYEFFDEYVWPKLAERIPAFEKLKVTSAWAGYYDYNTYDQNAIIGQHPLFPCLWFLTGFSGHGLQQAYAASAGLAETIIHGKSEIDIKPFSFRRVINQTPLREKCII